MKARGAAARPLIDPRRSFLGAAQLTDYEVKVIGWARRNPLRVVMEKGQAEYWSGKNRIWRPTAERLIRFNYLLPQDAALLPDLPAQTCAPGPR